MDHERAERLISERLDGERLSSRDTVALERHLETCAECRAFERGAYRLRDAARFEIAPAVPDLVEQIMTSVEKESQSRPAGIRVVRPMRLPQRRSLLPRLAPAIAALLVGLLAGSLVVGGPWRHPESRFMAALAAEDVTDRVAGAAPSLDSYAARFSIVERNLGADVPVREMGMRVWFNAPEQFRMDVVDRTDYPTRATKTDLRLVVNGDRWYSSAPAPCPLPKCPKRETSIRNRAPFSSHAPAPTDLVLPLVALAEPESFEVLRIGRALEREAVVVEVPWDRASSLFPFLSMGGRWRPFFPNDHVRIWLDASSWFPLRWRVFPARGPARDQWQLRFGLEEERPRRWIFDVVASSVRLSAPPADVFEIPSTARTEDLGARAVALGELPRETGYEPVAPSSELGGLGLYRVVIPDATSDEQTLVTYADGLSFVKLGETRSWTADSPFGLTDVRAEEVVLGGGSVGYYEPATGTQGRRLSIHAAGTDLYVETNLPRERLLDVGASLPVTGLEMPDEWRVHGTDGALVERVTLEEAQAALPFEIAMPQRLPAGFTLASAEIVEVEGDVGVNLYFRDAEVDVGVGTVRLHLEAGRELPPATAARQSAVEVGDAEGSDLRLADLLAIADSMAGDDAGQGFLPGVR